MNPPTPDTLRAALSFIPPDLPRDEWARVAMALKSELGQAGFDLFDAWSKNGKKYQAKAAESTWKSVKTGGGVTIGTLLHLAQGHGWKPDERDRHAPPPSPEELARREAEHKDREAREEAERQAAQQAAAEKARELWNSASDTGESAYLARKGVKAHGVRFAPNGLLLVPVRDEASELWNLQRIAPEKLPDADTDKFFLKGGRKSGLWHMLGEPEGAPVLLMAEGYATAATAHEATGRPVAVCWDAGNLPQVAKALRKRYPGARLLACGDDDREEERKRGRNPGREKAAAAAKIGKGAAVFPEGLPEDAGKDFNDLAALAGLEAVRELIEPAALALEGGTPSPAPAPAKKKAPAARKPAAQGEDGEAGPGEDAPAAFDRFRCDDGGVWYSPPNDEDGRVRRVCDPLRVLARARDTNGNGWAFLLEFDTPDRKGRRWLMPQAMLAGDGAEYRRELLAQGFMTPSDQNRRRWLTEYLQSRRPPELLRIVDRVGWHGRAYVLPSETLGNDAGEGILFQSEGPSEDTFSRRGTLAQWQERIGSRCVGNSRLAFAASCAFAGPLLMWASGTDGGGFHLCGDSSCGKTTALRVAASVWGGRDFLQRWRATDNGLEAQAVQHSDALMVLDELAQLDPKVAGESAYMLANGQGKARAGRSGGARPRLTWRLLFLSAGEIGLAEHMSEANKRTRAGQELRMVDMPADAGAGLGIFETLHDHEGGGALSQYLTRACEATHGTPGRAWLEWLVQNTEGLSRTLRERMDAIEAQFVPELAAGQVQRVGRRFALVAAAGEMATEAGITGREPGEATNAARRCFNAWIEARPGGIGTSEEAAMLRQVRHWLAAHGEARFTDWNRADDDHAPKTMNRAGWRKAVKEAGSDRLVSWEFFVQVDVFRAEVAKGFNYRAALKLLDERGHLMKGHGKHYARKESPPGSDGVQVYRIKSSILAGDDDE